MRLLIPLAAVAALAFSTTASAAMPKNGTFEAKRDQIGKIQLGWSMSFKVKGKKITDVAARVLERCSGSSYSTTTTVGPNLTWKVKKGGRFSGRKKETYDSLTLWTTLRGRFVNRNTAKGVLRQQSIIAGATCDTYELKFTLKRR